MRYMGFEDGLKKGEKRTSVPSIKQGGESESDRKGFFEKVVGKINDLSGMPSKEVMAEWDADLKRVEEEAKNHPEKMAALWKISSAEEEKDLLEYMTRDPYAAQAVALFRRLQDPNLSVKDFFSQMSLFNTGEGEVRNRPKDPSAPLREGESRFVVKRILPTRLIRIEYFENGHVDLAGVDSSEE